MSVVHASLVRCAAPFLFVVWASCIGCSDGGGTAPDPNASPVIYAACGLQPNYVGSVLMSGRFRRFPIAVHVDVSAAAPSFQTMYGPAIQQGIGSWAAAGMSEIGTVRFVTHAADAQVQLRFIPFVTDAPTAFASTLVTEVEPGVRTIISQTLIEFSSRNMRVFEGQVDIGLRPANLHRDWIVGLAAHEFGHSLGIQTHTGSGGPFLMAVDGFERNTEPTETDLNTIRDNYCRP